MVLGLPAFWGTQVGHIKLSAVLCQRRGGGCVNRSLLAVSKGEGGAGAINKGMNHSNLLRKTLLRKIQQEGDLAQPGVEVKVLPGLNLEGPIRVSG